MTETAPIRVMVVDDHFIAREGLRSIVSAEADMAVVCEAASCAEAVSAYAPAAPHVTVMDVRLPDRSGIEAIVEIRKVHPDSRFVVLTSHDGDELIHRALAAGAQSYLYKDMVRGELIAAIRAVHSGRKYIPVEVAGRLYEFSSHGQVTARELDVLRLVAEGKSNRDIAGQLGITEFTVKAHIQSMLGKLDASDRTHAVTIAVKRGLLFL